ncbi:MAG: hypothetical protein EBS05_02630 [Proteobacteria bacterium]|nr:hypothetical protein [Pseudomonadota bacterium]NDF00841.1 hypothetical protein [Verrucomicrobiota bacterium]
MSQLAAIRDDAAVQGLEFLLIGGNAIIAYGVERETADLDLMVRREQLAKWQELLKCHGYTVFHDGGNFMQFNPPADDAWAVDVMIVNDPTFGKMRAASQSIELWGEQWRIPSPAHLVALKLHALKHGGKHRQIRDFLDVVELVQRQRLDLNSPEMHTLFAQYGPPDMHRKVLLACS